MPSDDSSPTIRSLASQAVAEGAIDLSQGVVHAKPPKVLFDLFAATYEDRLAHGYGPTAGDPVFLQSVSRLVSSEFPGASADNIAATAGVIGGIISSLLAHCSAGANILVPEPFFSGYPWAIEAVRCRAVYIPNEPDWSPNWEILEREAPAAKAILITNPSNPSGYVWPPEQLQRLLAVARKHDLLVIADEIYADFVWGGEYHSLVNDALHSDDIVVLRGFSKSLAVAGWRVGYAIAAPGVIRRISREHDKICPGGVSALQRVLGLGWRDHGQELHAFINWQRKAYRQSRDELAEIFRQAGFTPFLPSGAIYMMLKHNRADDISAMKEMLARRIALTPGRIFFGSNSLNTDLVRIHFAVPKETVAEVKKRLLLPVI